MASDNIGHGAAETALGIVVFNGDYSATALPGILEDGLLVERFDGEGIHHPHLYSRGFQGLGCEHRLLKGDAGANDECLVVGTTLDDVGLPDLKLEVVFVDDWRGRPAEPDERNSLGVGGQLNRAFARDGVRRVEDGAPGQGPTMA